MKRFALIAFLAAQGILFAQAPNGVITGRVLGIDGKPAAGVRVAAASPNANGQITAETLVAITTTDATGQYRLENVPPGRYGVIAGAVEAPTYFPGVAEGSEARLVTIVPGSTISALDFALITDPLAPQKRAVAARVSVAIEPEFAIGVGPRRPNVYGRVVVEGNKQPEFSDLSVTFAGDGNAMPNPAISTSTVQGGRKTVITGSKVSATIGVDGSIVLELGRNEYVVSLTRWDGALVDGYTVKSIALGSIDLVKQKLKVDGLVAGEIVITLALVP